MRFSLLVLPIVFSCGGIVEMGSGSGAPDAGVPDVPAPLADATGRCGAGSYCSFADKRCGDGVSPCICKPVPLGCERDLVCGCDGRTYTNPCAAYAAGVDLRTTGGCTAPSGFVACGSRFCDIAMTYCAITLSDVGEEPNMNQCIVLPAPCGAAATCSCLPNTTGCLGGCKQAPSGGLVLTCPGG